MILVVLLLLFLLFILTPVRVEIVYWRQEQKDYAEVVVSFWFRWLRFRRTLPQMDWQGLTRGLEMKTDKKQKVQITKDRVEELKENMNQMIDLIPDFIRNLRRFFRHVHCSQFHWKTVIGTGDAMETGMISGLMWTIKTNLYTFLNQWIQFDRLPEFEVVPHFTQSVLSISFQSIIRFRMGHAILAMSHVLRQYWKRRRITWQKNTPFRA
jgi:hypothetical protein